MANRFSGWAKQSSRLHGSLTQTARKWGTQQGSPVNALFLLAGAAIGFRCQLMALVFALPLSVVIACLFSYSGVIAPGIRPILVLSILFEFGFFAGCVVHSLIVDRAMERDRFASKHHPGRSG